MMGTIRRTSRRGQGLSEYGLVLGLVAVVSIAALSSTGSAVQGLLGQITGAVAAGTNPCDVEGCRQTCIDAFLASSMSVADRIAVSDCMSTCFQSFNAANCSEEEPQ